VEAEHKQNGNSAVTFRSEANEKLK